MLDIVKRGVKTYCKVRPHRRSRGHLDSSQCFVYPQRQRGFLILMKDILTSRVPFGTGQQPTWRPVTMLVWELLSTAGRLCMLWQDFSPLQPSCLPSNVEKLAGLHNHFNRVRAHRSLLTEFTVRNYCGNSFHPDHIQAAIGHPERLRSLLTEPVEPPTKSWWTGVIHPKQARAQYHALREQVQTLARAQRVRDLTSKQAGLDPMPDFPIHAWHQRKQTTFTALTYCRSTNAAQADARHPHWNAFLGCRYWKFRRHPSFLFRWQYRCNHWLALPAHERVARAPIAVMCSLHICHGANPTICVLSLASRTFVSSFCPCCRLGRQCIYHCLRWSPCSMDRLLRPIPAVTYFPHRYSSMELPQASEHSLAAYTSLSAEWHLTSPVPLHQPKSL